MGTEELEINYVDKRKRNLVLLRPLMVPCVQAYTGMYNWLWSCLKDVPEDPATQFTVQAIIDIFLLVIPNAFLTDFQKEGDSQFDCIFFMCLSYAITVNLSIHFNDTFYVGKEITY